MDKTTMAVGKGENYDKFEQECEDTVLTPTSSATSLSPESILYHQSEKYQQDYQEFLPLQQQKTHQDTHHHHHVDFVPLQQPPLRRTQPHADFVPLQESPRQQQQQQTPSLSPVKTSATFCPMFSVTRLFGKISTHMRHSDSLPTWIAFWALLMVTCANYVLTPMRDAIALAVGVHHIPKLTLASTLLAVISSVPIGWLFEAPDPVRRKLWKRMGLTRGETQGTSLALFYRMFALSLLIYAIGFKLVDYFRQEGTLHNNNNKWSSEEWSLLGTMGNVMYVAFFLVVHLMKLHSLSLLWGVTTEAMEYEEVAKKRMRGSSGGSKTRLQRMAFVGFGGTLGGILGSVIASSMAHILQMSGLLVVAALMLEIAAELSIELGRIMQKHWEEQQHFKSTDDLTTLDSSMKRSVSTGSMKRVASGNSLHNMKRVQSGDALKFLPPKNLAALTKNEPSIEEEMNDNSFAQRLMRGITTILRSRLLMAIFTYNALYASTSVLLSFQRAALVANRNASSTTVSDTAFLANINMASSVAVFALQLSGVGAYIAHKCGSRGTLAVMPIFRLLGVFALAWWHRASNGKPPNLIIFLLLDECTRVMNLAVAKPVRESLWRGLSNEARYEAKPIVDTLANRWGGGSAAFLVSLMDKALDLFGVAVDGGGARTMFGFPPVLFLCMIVAAWWAMVSADLGHIRHRIDLELKKQQ